MICILAMITFGILGIFSVRYRRLAGEAFHCVFRRATLRPCDTEFDQKVKVHLIGRLLRKSPKIARFTYKNFEAISWIFTILFFISLFFTLQGVYNLVVFGSCEPHSDTCIFQPGVLTCGSPHCAEKGCECGENESGCKEPVFAGCNGNCECNTNVCG